MDNSLVTQKERFKTYTLWLFAAVGAVASLLTIVNLTKSENAQLQVDIYPNEIYIPSTIKSQLSALDSDNFRSFILTRLSDSCELKEASMNEAEPSEDVPNGVKDKPACEQIGRFLNSTDLLSKLTSQTTFFEYKIKNTGKSVAKNIRLSGINIIGFEAYSGNGRISSDEKDPVNGSYILPNLNPNETLDLSVWTNGYPNYSYDEIYVWDSLPQITFEKNSVSLNVWTHVPSQAYAVYDFLNTFPWWISWILVLGVSLLISFLSILVISIPIGLIQGKSFKEIFSSDTVEKETTDNPSPQT